jgi:hypothetical protein
LDLQVLSVAYQKTGNLPDDPPIGDYAFWRRDHGAFLTDLNRGPSMVNRRTLLAAAAWTAASPDAIALPVPPGDRLAFRY